jgi:cellulose synthase/poly-beta-1,6-N-acetylglucosamine synthase-like glycosyltransferase
MTDADCQSNNRWLAMLASEYQESGAYMLCGPVTIMSESGFLQQFQSLELCGLSLLSGAGINLGIPLLCNGANVAYTRKVFDDVEGFKGIDAHPSGDDVLLMFKVHKKYPGKIQYVKSKNAFVSTSAQISLRDFMEQHIRWASKAHTAKNSMNSLVSILVFTTNFLCLVAILCILVCEKLFFLLMCGIAVKILADFLLLLVATHFFGKKKLLWIFPLAGIFTMLYITWVGISANFSSYQWKGRQYKQAI